ncbi:MAG TPA: oligosaccharide flippase family protein [Candidatus Bathyarchaeia archaeon]|nr:oligosaccharide flippase family protein [Candidatus Bathyarchaeia archaeon]
MSARFDAERVARGSVYLLIMNVVNYVVFFLFYGVLARVVSTADVGFLSFMMLSMTAFNTLTLLALNSAVVKYVAEFAGSGKDGLASLVAGKAFRGIVLASVPAVLVAFLVVSVGNVFRLDAAQAYAVMGMVCTGFVVNLTSYYGGVMYGFGMYLAVTVQNVVFTVLSRFLGLLLAWRGYGLAGISAGFLVGALVCLCYSVIVLRGRLVKPEGDFSYGQLFSYSWPLYLSGLIGLWSGWISLLVLQLVVGSLSLTGVYYLVTSGAGFLGISWSSVGSALFPAMSARLGDGDSSGLSGFRDWLEGSLRVITTLVLPTSVALACVAPTALTIVYGTSYVMGSVPFAIVISVAIFSAYSSIYSTVLTSAGRTIQVAYIGILSTLAGTILAPMLTKWFSITGAILSTVAITFGGFFLGYLFVRRLVDFRLDRYSIWRSFMVAVCLAPVLLGADELMRNYSLNVVHTALLDFVLFLAWGVANLVFWKPFSLRDVEVIEKALPSRLGRVSSLLRHCAREA